MWWPLADIDGTGPSIDVGEFEFELVMQDIESLNGASVEGLYDITAISIANYPLVASTYQLTACGASLGDGYGPKIVGKEQVSLDSLFNGECTFAVPGLRTSALAALRILAGERKCNWKVVDFTEIMDCVSTGECDAGVVIHEGQLTHEEHGLYELCDLGSWWQGETGLPLPLGGNAMKRDVDERFGEGATERVSQLLLQSIEYALTNREKSLAWALQWGRGIDLACTDEFVEMYVNKWTLDFGDAGKQAVLEFLSRASKVGAVPAIQELEFV